MYEKQLFWIVIAVLQASHLATRLHGLQKQENDAETTNY